MVLPMTRVPHSSLRLRERGSAMTAPLRFTELGGRLRGLKRHTDWDCDPQPAFGLTDLPDGESTNGDEAELSIRAQSTRQGQGDQERSQACGESCEGETIIHGAERTARA